MTMSTAVICIFVLFDFLVFCFFLSYSVAFLCFFVPFLIFCAFVEFIFAFASPTTLRDLPFLPPGVKTKDSREEISITLFLKN